MSNLYKLAIDIATDQDAKSFILRGAMALYKFDGQEEQMQMARDLLAKTHQWFDSGIDDELLVEAEAIIKQAK